MKHSAICLILLLLSFSCKNDDDSGCVSELLPSYPFDTGNAINLAFYQPLTIPSNGIEINNYGVKGIFLFNTGSSIVAFERSDPAHGPNDCSQMKIEPNGIEVKCECNDGNKYLLLTGQQTSGDTGHCLRAYSVQRSGNIIRVYN